MSRGARDCNFNFTCLSFIDLGSQPRYCRNVVLHWHRHVTHSIYLQRVHAVCRMGSADLHQLSSGPSVHIHSGVRWVCGGVGTARSCAAHRHSGRFPYSFSSARKRGQGQHRPYPACHWRLITYTSRSSNKLICHPAFLYNLQPRGNLKVFLYGKMIFKELEIPCKSIAKACECKIRNSNISKELPFTLGKEEVFL